MFKLFEKPPFRKWKFVQRMMHKRRMSKASGTNRFKTFSKGTPSNDMEHFIDTHSIDESESVVQSKTIKESPFYSKRRLDKANADIGIVTHEELKSSPKVLRRAVSVDSIPYDSEEEIDTTETGAALHDDDDAGAALHEDEEAEETLADGHLISSPTMDTKPQYSALSLGRNSKLRNSFKEFKRRSMNQLDNARESMRRRANARKYDNLDEKSKASKDDKEDLVTYERSPGSKRRTPQVIEI